MIFPAYTSTLSVTWLPLLSHHTHLNMQVVIAFEIRRSHSRVITVPHIHPFSKILDPLNLVMGWWDVRGLGLR